VPGVLCSPSGRRRALGSGKLRAGPSNKWRWGQLRDALRALAADPEEQLDRLGTMHPDELALDFDDARQLILGIDAVGGVLSPEAIDVLETLDSELDATSGEHNAALWTADALRDSDRWRLVRDLAQRALSLLPDRP
jgi:hypothetical protein